MAKPPYKPRIADAILAEKLKGMGAVLIEGAKWCGKTTTAEQQAKSVIYMDDPVTRNNNIEAAEINPSLILNGATPRLIDEWQIAPGLWDAVRFTVDHRGDDGQFILTGSAVPPEDKTVHTGTGRIARVRMRPMTLWESGESTGDISLKALFDGENPVGTNSRTLEDIAYMTCRGGWPRAIFQEPETALGRASDYFDAVVNADINRTDSELRNPARAAMIMRSYARLIGSQAPLTAICADISSTENNSADSRTIQSYINALKLIFVIEDMPAWNPNLRSKTAIRTSETRYFVDPSVGAAALGIGPDDLTGDLRTFGFFFENLCVRDLRVYAEKMRGSVYHFRDAKGLECDAVVHLRNGKYGLIEIKLGGDRLIDEGAANLLKLRDKINTDNMREPSFMMVLTAVGPYAFRHSDGVYVVPVTCLKD